MHWHFDLSFLREGGKKYYAFLQGGKIQSSSIGENRVRISNGMTNLIHSLAEVARIKACTINMPTAIISIIVSNCHRTRSVLQEMISFLRC